MKHEELKERFFEGAPRYRWLETLGRGAVGVVFKAQDLTLDDVVAIKVLSPDVERDDQELLQRFKREINLNRKIKHPNVARMFDYGISGDYPYITMEFISGKDLWTLIDERQKLPASETVALLRQIARGAHAMHLLGIVHRDLKSENVVVDTAGAAVILDFGLARGAVSHNMTLDSVLLGTPHYMSPEQALGKKVDPRSDVYSMGIIAYEMLTGRLPFNANSPVAVAMKQVSHPLPTEPLKDVPEELADVVKRACEKDPEKRYASAEDFETELALLKLVPPGAERRPSDELSEAVDSALDAIVMTGRPGPPPRPGPPTVPLADQRRPVGVPLVLVVNDDVRELLKLATAICQTGCRTLEVHSGEEALDALTKQAADLVVLDVDLGGMDGFDVTRILKSQRGKADIPVLLTTRRQDRSQLAFAIQSGAADLLTKPVAPAVLHDAIWKILQHRGFIREAAAEPSSRGVRAPTRSKMRRP
ncbi:MAG TPA: serine/threonine-protein kinase [Thermoanaerobaculia bacterium]|nr:serine/threonine-protein kinase [Thermoanaerobaculia bacterium]